METIINSIMDYGLKLILALAIFFIGKWIAERLVNLCKRLMERNDIDDTLVSFGGNILYGLAMAFVVITALSQIGVDTTSLAAVVAAAGLAIGLAMQSSLSNFAAGVMIILFRPFKIGHYIEAGGSSGTVEEISIFTTTLKSPDNKQIVIPNGTITSGNITNYSAKETRRVDLVVGVGYGDDLQKVKQVLNDLVTSDERILDDPAPVIAVSELADSSVNLVVRPWVKSADYWDVYFELTEKIKTSFDREGISIPFPQRDINLVGNDKVQIAAE